MDAINSNSGLDVKTAASIYAQKKSQEVKENEVMQAMKTLDENTQKQAMQDVAQITGRGANLNIQG